MKLTFEIWRQENAEAQGRFETYALGDVHADWTFLEALDQLNEDLTAQGRDPVAFDSDCREGICGMCGLVINGIPHGKNDACTTCCLRMRAFDDGETVTVEPFRAAAFPVIKDLVVDRSAFDRIIARGGYVSVNTGSAPDAGAMPIPKADADAAMVSATCIGCGACVAACPNASSSLFTAAKIAQYSYLPQGQAERERRVMAMVDQMDAEGFGDCSNHAECQAVCPMSIGVENIAIMRRDYWRGIRAQPPVDSMA